jgi:acetyltransferase-like isoleucine patch superfamily enzyme
MRSSPFIAPTALVHPGGSLGSDTVVGDFSILGRAGVGGVRTAARVKIGCYSILGPDVDLAEGVEIDDFCKVSDGTIIGQGSRILYGARIYAEVRIGAFCIVAGELADGTVLEDDVTFMGRISHAYRAPVGPRRWDDPDCAQPSPVIRAQSVVGEGAMLIGGISVGPRAYIGAGEFVRSDVPPDSVMLRGTITPLAQWKGFIKVREPGGY